MGCQPILIDQQGASIPDAVARAVRIRKRVPDDVRMVLKVDGLEVRVQPGDTPQTLMHRVGAVRDDVDNELIVRMEEAAARKETQRRAQAAREALEASCKELPGAIAQGVVHLVAWVERFVANAQRAGTLEHRERFLEPLRQAGYSPDEVLSAQAVRNPHGEEYGRYIVGQLMAALMAGGPIPQAIRVMAMRHLYI